MIDYNTKFLVPRVCSDIISRSECDTSVSLWGSHKLSIPIISSPIPDCTDGEFAYQMFSNGCIGFIHKFLSIEDQVLEFREATRKIEVGKHKVCGCAIGINGDYKERLSELYKESCRWFVLDCANGFSNHVGNAIKYCKDQYSDIKIIAGNIASIEGFNYLWKSGADAIRVGIATGNVCSTKIATGIFASMLDILFEIKNSYTDENDNLPLIIADGGIREPGEFCRCLAAGADLCMFATVLAASKDSPARVHKFDNKLFKVVRGAASFSVQGDFKNCRPRYIEGHENLIPINQSLDKLLNKYKTGLQSSMSYFNARTLKEYRSNVTWS